MCMRIPNAGWIKGGWKGKMQEWINSLALIIVHEILEDEIYVFEYGMRDGQMDRGRGDEILRLQ